MPRPSAARPWGNSAPRAERHPIDLSAQLGRAVRRLRKEQGVSQEELADRAQLDRVFISLLERGKRRATLESAQAIAAALGLSFIELVGQFESVPDEPKT